MDVVKDDTVNVDEKIDANGSVQLTITSGKKNSEYYVRKTRDGFAFFTVEVSKGSVPKALQKKFTGISSARDAVKAYLSKEKKSRTVKRDEYFAAKEK